MKRRGWTVRFRGRNVARVIIPSRRCRVGRDGNTVSLGFLLVRWF